MSGVSSHQFPSVPLLSDTRMVDNFDIFAMNSDQGLTPLYYCLSHNPDLLDFSLYDGSSPFAACDLSASMNPAMRGGADLEPFSLGSTVDPTQLIPSTSSLVSDWDCDVPTDLSDSHLFPPLPGPDQFGLDQIAAFNCASHSIEPTVSPSLVSDASHSGRASPSSGPDHSPVTPFLSPTFLGSKKSSYRASTTAGVKKSRAKKGLPELRPDPADPDAVRRAKNTEAARRSRARKLENNERMQGRIDELEEELERQRRETMMWKERALALVGHAQ